MSQGRNSALISLSLLLSLVVSFPLHARDKEKISYGEGLIANVPFPENEVEQVVQDVVQNGVIRGTKEYNRDEFVSGAAPASTCSVFAPWDQGGKILYKVREHAIDPRNFKDGGDVGTLAVRYVVMPQGDKNTVIRIDALFQEEFRRTIHQSNGSVESAEYKDIRDQLDAINVMNMQTAEAEKEVQEARARKQHQAAWKDVPADSGSSSSSSSSSAAMPPAETTPAPLPSPQSAIANVNIPSTVAEATPPAAFPPPQPSPEVNAAQLPGQSLQDHVKDLRHQLERQVKSPGAALKSAPFHTASTLQTLNTGAEVLILISSPYWYGIETHDGQHGWIMRDQLEQKPE